VDCPRTYQGEEESEKKIHFIHRHNDDVEGLFWIATLTLNENAYTLACRVLKLFVYYMCSRFLWGLSQ